MNKLIVVLFVLLIFSTGCTNPIRDAKAERIRERTRRSRDLHNQAMTDNRILEDTRLATKEVAMWVLTGSLSIMMISLTLASSYYFVALAANRIKHDRIQQIPLDSVTRQYPVLIYYGPANNPRSIDFNTGERRLLSADNDPDPLRIEATSRVQLGGLLVGSPSSKTKL